MSEEGGLAEGQEVLVVDGDEKVQHGLEQLLTSANLVPTVLPDPGRALDLSSEKFFAVALIDLDTPTVGAGVNLIAELHRRSPATTVLMMAARKHFDVAVAAFRAGAADVSVKAPDQVEYLKRRVVDAAAARRREADTSRVLGDTMALHEDLIKVLLDTFRKAVDLEERAAGGGARDGDQDTSVLLVDDDPGLGSQLVAALHQRGGYQLRTVSTGGEALDLGGREKFAIALIKDALPDLPGSMVVRTIKAQSPETIVLLYTAPGGGQAGSMQVMEGSRAIQFLPQFTEVGQILGRLDELREAALATTRERRYHAAFRQQHFDLLKRFAELRAKLQRQSGR
jgi:DNA-binding NtrC family response regulator